MRRSGFTLIEIMLVIAITGTLAGVLLPKMSFYFEPPVSFLQRTIEEAGDKALSGISVRLVLKPGKDSRRGEIEVEALLKKEVAADSLSAFLGTNKNSNVLEWQKIEMSNPPTGDGWFIEPDIIYFYTDGSCTPAKISYLDYGKPESDAENYILTVTGYCTKLP